MARYHVNPETGNPGVCTAQVQCRFGGDAAHYSSEQDARAAFELSMAGKAFDKESPRVDAARIKFPEGVQDMPGKAGMRLITDYLRLYRRAGETPDSLAFQVEGEYDTYDFQITVVNKNSPWTAMVSSGIRGEPESLESWHISEVSMDSFLLANARDGFLQSMDVEDLLTEDGLKIYRFERNVRHAKERLDKMTHGIGFVSNPRDINAGVTVGDTFKSSRKDRKLIKNEQAWTALQLRQVDFSSAVAVTVFAQEMDERRQELALIDSPESRQWQRAYSYVIETLFPEDQ